MKIKHAVLFGCVLSLAGFVAAALLYAQLPQEMPIHWGLHGNVDGTLAKPWGVFIHPGMIAAVTLLTAILPAISPNGFRIEPFARAYGLLMSGTILFFAYVTAIVFAVGLGAPVATGPWVIGGIGGLFMVLGNFLGKTTKNFFVGIRTPWTLASDEVWRRTHRLAGWLFVLAGLITIVGAIVGLGLEIALSSIVLAAIILVLYSFVLYRRLEPRGGSDHAT